MASPLSSFAPVTSFGGEPGEPILRRMDNFKNIDAILDLSDPEYPKEPEWPAVDFIVGNPPFLGDKLMRRELGDDYVDALRKFYASRLPGQSDLVCYWFEKARTQIEEGKCKRAGLLATQGIRGGANREVLKRIKQTGDIFFAHSDRTWILDGAMVHVSMVGFDHGVERQRSLNDQLVATINSDLSLATDTTIAGKLDENAGVAFIGTSMHGPFDLTEAVAVSMLQSGGNPTSRANSDVIRPILNAYELARRGERRWVVYFNPEVGESQAAVYEVPFEFVRQHVKPIRDTNHRKAYRDRWWLHGEPRPAMLAALHGKDRFLATPRVGKHRIFAWITSIFLPSDATVAFSYSDDYQFGILHSQLHEVWALKQGTQLREKESGFRYTPTTCFETFPFPKPTDEQLQAIAKAAKELDDLRTNWLNPPEWTREEILEFPGSIDGPWARYVHDPHEHGIGTVKYPRLVPQGDTEAEQLAKRTLTNLYNERPTWLDLAHRKLDEAVFAAYGWEPSMSDDEILAHLLALNQERASRVPAKT